MTDEQLQQYLADCPAFGKYQDMTTNECCRCRDQVPAMHAACDRAMLARDGQQAAQAAGQVYVEPVAEIAVAAAIPPQDIPKGEPQNADEEVNDKARLTRSSVVLGMLRQGPQTVEQLANELRRTIPTARICRSDAAAKYWILKDLFPKLGKRGFAVATDSAGLVTLTVTGG